MKQALKKSSLFTPTNMIIFLRRFHRTFKNSKKYSDEINACFINWHDEDRNFLKQHAKYQKKYAITNTE